MKNLISILLVVLLTALPSCKLFKGDKKIFGKKKAAELAAQLEEQKKKKIADSLKVVQEKIRALETARQDSIRLAEEARLAQASKYNIVVGSFITPEYARAWEQEYRTRGFDPKIVQMEGGRFELVVAESYETLGKAASRLNQIQESVQVDAWIYKKK